MIPKSANFELLAHSFDNSQNLGTWHWKLRVHYLIQAKEARYAPNAKLQFQKANKSPCICLAECYLLQCIAGALANLNAIPPHIPGHWDFHGTPPMSAPFAGTQPRIERLSAQPGPVSLSQKSPGANLCLYSGAAIYAESCSTHRFHAALPVVSGSVSVHWKGWKSARALGRSVVAVALGLYKYLMVGNTGVARFVGLVNNGVRLPG